MLATSKNVLFPGHNHLLTTGPDDPTLWLSPKCKHSSYLVESDFFAHCDELTSHDILLRDVFFELLPQQNLGTVSADWAIVYQQEVRVVAIQDYGVGFGISNGMIGYDMLEQMQEI